MTRAVIGLRLGRTFVRVNYRPTFGIRNLVLENCDAAGADSDIKLIHDSESRCHGCSKLEILFPWSESPR
jgi:hypothetical protein